MSRNFLQLCSLNQSERFEDLKKSYTESKFSPILHFDIIFSKYIILQAHCYSQQTCALMFSRLALSASERYTEWNATMRCACLE